MRTRTRKPNHPGGVLRRMYMEPLGLTVTALAAHMQISRKTLSAIVNERQGITPDIALRLSRVFKTTPELWLNMQQAHSLWVASAAHDDWKHIKPIPTDNGVGRELR